MSDIKSDVTGNLIQRNFNLPPPSMRKVYEDNTVLAYLLKDKDILQATQNNDNSIQSLMVKINNAYRTSKGQNPTDFSPLKTDINWPGMR